MPCGENNTNKGNVYFHDLWPVSTASICLYLTLLILLFNYPLYKIKFVLGNLPSLTSQHHFASLTFSRSYVEFIVRNGQFECVRSGKYSLSFPHFIHLYIFYRHILLPLIILKKKIFHINSINIQRMCSDPTFTTKRETVLLIIISLSKVPVHTKLTQYRGNTSTALRLNNQSLIEFKLWPRQHIY